MSAREETEILPGSGCAGPSAKHSLGSTSVCVFPRVTPSVITRIVLLPTPDYVRHSRSRDSFGAHTKQCSPPNSDYVVGPKTALEIGRETHRLPVATGVVLRGWWDRSGVLVRTERYSSGIQSKYQTCKVIGKAENQFLCSLFLQSNPPEV